MKLSALKSALNNLDQVRFKLPDGQYVPEHFHVTEVGQVSKHFIDCGGTVRKESVINFQLWTAEDHDHRLSASKLQSIIELSEKHLQLEDQEIEVEFQQETIGKYHLALEGNTFQLLATQTDCLAKDKCGIPTQKPKIGLADIQSTSACCTPENGCC